MVGCNDDDVDTVVTTANGGAPRATEIKRKNKLSVAIAHGI